MYLWSVMSDQPRMSLLLPPWVDVTLRPWCSRSGLFGLLDYYWAEETKYWLAVTPDLSPGVVLPVPGVVITPASHLSLSPSSPPTAGQHSRALLSVSGSVTNTAASSPPALSPPGRPQHSQEWPGSPWPPADLNTDLSSASVESEGSRQLDWYCRQSGEKYNHETGEKVLERGEVCRVWCCVEWWGEMVAGRLGRGWAAQISSRDAGTRPVSADPRYQTCDHHHHNTDMSQDQSPSTAQFLFLTYSASDNLWYSLLLLDFTVFSSFIESQGNKTESSLRF